MLPENHQLLLRTRMQFGLGVVLLLLLTILLTRQCNRLEREELTYLEGVQAAQEHDRGIMDEISDSILVILDLSGTLDSLTGAYPGADTRIGQEAIRTQFRRVESQMVKAMWGMQWLTTKLNDPHPLVSGLIDETMRLQIVQVAHAFSSADVSDINTGQADLTSLQTQLHEARTQLLESQRALSKCEGAADKVDIARQLQELKEEAGTQHLYGYIDGLIDYLRLRQAADQGLSAEQAAEVEGRLQILLNSRRPQS